MQTQPSSIDNRCTAVTLVSANGTTAQESITSHPSQSLLHVLVLSDQTSTCSLTSAVVQPPELPKGSSRLQESSLSLPASSILTANKNISSKKADSKGSRAHRLCLAAAAKRVSLILFNHCRETTGCDLVGGYQPRRPLPLFRKKKEQELRKGVKRRRRR